MLLVVLFLLVVVVRGLRVARVSLLLGCCYFYVSCSGLSL